MTPITDLKVGDKIRCQSNGNVYDGKIISIDNVNEVIDVDFSDFSGTIYPHQIVYHPTNQK